MFTPSTRRAPPPTPPCACLRPPARTAPHTTLEKSYTSTFLTNHRNTFPWSTNASGIQLCRYSNGFLGKKLIYA